MPRLPRIHIEGALYYVTCRAEPEQKLFQEKRDYEMYLEFLKKYRQDFGFKVYAYVLLPNHIHLLIEPSQKATISEIMHILNGSYSKYYNSAYERKGHLFRERFKACLVEKDNYLVQLTSYIHLNPKRMGLVDKPQDYPYSSLPAYMDEGADFEDEANYVLKYLKEETYGQLLQRMINQPSPELHKSLQRRGILGSKDFVQRMKEIIKEKEKETDKKEEAYPITRKVVSISVAGLGIAVVGVIVVLVYLGKEEPKSPVVIEKIVDSGVREIKDLNSTEWNIKLTSMSGDDSYDDTLHFTAGKFTSRFLNQKGFSATNFTVVQEGKKIIWETFQSSGDDSASWRGEVEADKMRGILSLRTRDEAQDFSFISIGYRRRE